MSTRDDGGPAFARGGMVEDKREGEMYWSGYDGMSLRDYFAAAALQGLMASRAVVGGEDFCSSTPGHVEAFASVAYTVADAMLAERAK